jgi:hypothetical protein
MRLGSHIRRQDRPAMPTRLSSRLTPLFTRVFPPLWIAGFGAGTAALWLGAMDDPDPPPLFFKLYFLVIWLVGAAFLIWFVRRTSDVWIDGHDLIVARGRSEERIPLADVEEVTETRIWNPKQIKLRIRSRHKVVFIAPWAFQLPFSTHRVVGQLREAIEHAQTRR